MSEYAKKSEIPSMDNFATKDELPDMDNVATKDELFSGDYNDLTNKPTIPDTSNFALKSELPDMSNVATKDEIPIIPEFKTINGNSIIGTGNITIEGGDQAYDDTEIRNLIVGKQDKLNEEQLANIGMDHSTFALKSELPDMSNVATKDELPNLDDYALKSEIPTSTGLNADEVNALIDAKLGEVETKLSEI